MLGFGLREFSLCLFKILTRSDLRIVERLFTLEAGASQIEARLRAGEGS
jgi:hypothetical protein